MIKSILFISTTVTLATSSYLWAGKGSDFIDALHSFSDDPYHVTTKVGVTRLTPSAITIELQNDLEAKRDPHLPHIIDFASDEALDNYMTSLLIQQMGMFLLSRATEAPAEESQASLPDTSDQGFEDAYSEGGNVASTTQDTSTQEADGVTTDESTDHGSPQSMTLKIPKTAFMYTALKHAHTYDLNLASGSNSTTKGLMTLKIQIEPETMPDIHWITYGLNMQNLGEFFATIRMTLLRKIRAQITEAGAKKAKHSFYN